MNSNETEHFQLISIHEKFDAMFKGLCFPTVVLCLRIFEGGKNQFSTVA